ncbi:unnamed protein product [Prunus armeniaca]
MNIFLSERLRPAPKAAFSAACFHFSSTETSTATFSAISWGHVTTLVLEWVCLRSPHGLSQTSTATFSAISWGHVTPLVLEWVCLRAAF